MRPYQHVGVCLLKSSAMAEQPNHEFSPPPNEKDNEALDGPPEPIGHDTSTILLSIFSGVCWHCAKICKLVGDALDNLPPEFDDIYSDAPEYVHIADVGYYYRPWYLKKNFGYAMLSNYYNLTIGRFVPACPLCSMLAATQLGTTSDSDTSVGDELRLFRLNEQFVWDRTYRPRSHDFEAIRTESPLCLAVTRKPTDEDGKSGFYQRLGPSFEGYRKGFTVIGRRGQISQSVYLPRIVKPQFDAALVRQWLGYCRDHHRGPCVAGTDLVRGLHLIDCRARSIVAAPTNAAYVALSYCWGAPELSRGRAWWLWDWTGYASSPDSASDDGSDDHVGDDINFSLPPVVPSVISDAMEVAVSLGFSYLWVDRYCIDQKSAAKHDQISQMDRIYQGAELTIFATAGDDPSYGLPGVSSRAKRQQHSCSVGDLDIIHTMPHPHRAIEASAWSTRAWTFQEGILSRRRLVFTDDQVYFECEGMNCYESIASRLDDLHTDDKTRFRECLRSGIFGRSSSSHGDFDTSSRKPEGQESLLRQMIEQYSQRTLTYDSDSLNAFVGIFRRFEGQPAFINNIWGLPFRLVMDEEGTDAPEQTENSFVSGLGWSQSPLRGTGIPPPTRRREGVFPSWSWCGWAGDVSYSQPPTRSLLRSLALEDSHGTLLSPAEYLRKFGSREMGLLSSPALHVTGVVLPQGSLTLTYSAPPWADTNSKPNTLAVFGIKTHPQYSIRRKSRENACDGILEGGTERCVLLGDLDSYRNSPEFLILEPLGGEDWQRVGILSPHIEHEGKPEDDGIFYSDDRDLYNQRADELREIPVRAFYKAWVDLELGFSIEPEEADAYMAKLPTQTFRIL